MTRKVTRRCRQVAAVLCVLLAAFGGSAPARAEEFLIRYAAIFGPDDSVTKAQQRFKEEVERESQGRIKVQIYYGTQLAGGNTIDQLRFLKLGAIEMNNVGFAQMSQEAADFGALTLPFLFLDTKAANATLHGKAVDVLQAGSRKVGLQILGFHYNGLRNLLTATKPVHSLADMKGLKLRVVQGAVPLATYRALGANPVAMDFAEVPAGMTQGVVDGTDLPVAPLVGVKAYSYGRHYTIMRTYLEGGSVMINQAFFRKLPPDLQAIVTAAVDHECAFQLQQNWDDEASSLQVLKNEGVEVYTMSDADLEAARGLVKGVYKEFEAKFTPGLLDLLGARR